MRQFAIFVLLIITKLSLGQEYKIAYGDKRYMKYHYHCSHDNGYTLKKNLKNGAYKVYSKENPDIILIQGQYRNQVKDGDWVIFNPYERSTEYQTFKNGELTKEYGIDSLGRMTMDIVHGQDSIVSIYYGYYSADNFRYIDQYRQSKSDQTTFSKSTYYYLNGQIKSIINYINGDGHGKSFEYYENGKAKMEYENWNGKQVGIWRWWNENGELTKEEDFGHK